MRFTPALLLLGGCLFPSTKYMTYPPNPSPETKRIVVLPFMNLTTESRLDTDEMANLFASELVKFPGFEVVRPVLVRAALKEGEKIATVEDLIRVARRLKADAVVAVAVTDHSPYDPPKTALALQFFRTKSLDLSSADLERIIQSATWRGPFGIDRSNAGYLITAFEEVWDAHNKNVRDEVKAYADAQVGEDTAFPNETQFLAVQERWIQFVSNQAINRFIQRTRRR